MKVLLDTNFLMIPNQFGVDVFEYLRDYEVFTLSSCKDELEKIAKGRGNDRKAARVALELIKDRKIDIVRTRKKGDSSIVDYAAKNNNITVATNDIALIKALKNKGIKVIRLRQKKILVEE